MEIVDLLPLLKEAPLYIVLFVIIYYQYKKNERVETAKDDLTKEYLKSVQDANKDLMEATRIFDRLLQARGQ